MVIMVIVMMMVMVVVMVMVMAMYGAWEFVGIGGNFLATKFPEV